MKLRNAEFIKDSVASFMINCRGNPVPDIKIFKDGSPIKEDSRVTVFKEHAANGSYELVIHKVQDSDAGVYKVEATNSHGKAETEAKVGIKDAKDVFALLKGKEKKLGPGEEPSFTWFKGGQEFDPDDRFKVLFKDEEDTLALMFQHINPEDAGLYTCIANTGGNKIALSAKLTVEGAMSQLLKQPTDKHKLVTPTFVYPDTETVTLLITKVTGDDVGTYKAVIHNNLCEASTEATMVPPGSSQSMEPVVDVKTGNDEPYKITAKVTGAPELTWYKDGVPITKDPRVKCYEGTTSNSCLTINSASRGMAGEYHIKASNEMGSVDSKCNLKVNTEPSADDMNDPQKAFETDDFTFSVECDNPKPSATWTKDGKGINCSAKDSRSPRPRGSTISRSPSWRWMMKAPMELSLSTGQETRRCLLTSRPTPLRN